MPRAKQFTAQHGANQFRISLVKNLIYETSTSICFGLDDSALGSKTLSTPFLNPALTESGSASSGQIASSLHFEQSTTPQP